MERLEFSTLEFEEKEDIIEATLLKNFTFSISRQELGKAGDYSVSKNSIEVEKPKKFFQVLSGSMNSLRNRLNKKPAVYIHKNSGIPLIGNLFFGIVDRGTTLIEVKPLTSCNLNCIFCSVDEGLASSKANDFVVEEEYIIDELRSLLEFKACDDIEIFINPHGEPLLYADIVRLVKDMKRIKQVKKVSIITNGSLLTEDILDELKEAGLDQLNISVNSLDEKNSRMIAGTAEYDINRIKEMIDQALSKGIRIVLAPVWVPGVNDQDIEDIIRYCKKKGCEPGIQKYVRHKKGRNPKAKEMDWNGFFAELERLEGKYGHGIRHSAPEKTKELPRPFRTGDVIEALIACNGRYSDEKIAVSKGRTITVYDCPKSPGEAAKIRIIKSKNNIFFGK